MESKVTNQHFFQTILNQTTDMLLICNKERNVLFSTPNFKSMFGHTDEEWRKMDAFTIVHPDDLQLMIDRHRHHVSNHANGTAEYRVITKNGEIRYCECKTTPLLDTEEFLQVVSVRDVTERKIMEIELEASKNRYEVLQQSLKSFSRDLSLVMKLSDLEDRLLKEIRKILAGSNPTLLFMSDVKNTPFVIGKILTQSDQIQVKIGEWEEKTYVLSIKASSIKENMESIWLETLIQYTVMVFENLKAIENLMSQLETAVESKKTPQWVLRLLFNLQEQQRLTLSSDLHDTVLQDQIALYRKLEDLLKRLDLGEESKGRLKEIEQGLLDIIHEIRKTCNELRPPLLRELGIERALENLFEHTQVSSTYKIEFFSDAIPPLSEELTIGIYRIVQELLLNAENHSRASIVNFQIRCRNGVFKMEYYDNGVGFDEVKLNPSFNSMGLTSMIQRAESLGGNIEFNSKQDIGLRVNLELPLIEERSIV